MPPIDFLQAATEGARTGIAIGSYLRETGRQAEQSFAAQYALGQAGVESILRVGQTYVKQQQQKFDNQATERQLAQQDLRIGMEERRLVQQESEAQRRADLNMLRYQSQISNQNDDNQRGWINTQIGVGRYNQDIAEDNAEQQQRQAAYDMFGVPTTPAQANDIGIPAQVTRYGYKGDPNADSFSAKGIGNRSNKLVEGSSVALKLSTAQQLGAVVDGRPSGKVIVEHPDGRQQVMNVDDRVPEESGNNHRVDYYDPSGKVIPFDGSQVMLYPYSIGASSGGNRPASAVGMPPSDGAYPSAGLLGDDETAPAAPAAPAASADADTAIASAIGRSKNSYAEASKLTDAQLNAAEAGAAKLAAAAMTVPKDGLLRGIASGASQAIERVKSERIAAAKAKEDTVGKPTAAQIKRERDAASRLESTIPKAISQAAKAYPGTDLITALESARVYKAPRLGDPDTKKLVLGDIAKAIEKDASDLGLTWEAAVARYQAGTLGSTIGVAPGGLSPNSAAAISGYQESLKVAPSSALQGLLDRLPSRKK